jgi:hypothetical protein
VCLGCKCCFGYKGATYWEHDKELSCLLVTLMAMRVWVKGTQVAGIGVRRTAPSAGRFVGWLVAGDKIGWLHAYIHG